MKIHDIQMSESLSIGLLLASVGGFLESYSFLSRNGVFANCQTGNLVLMALYFTQGNLEHTLSYFIPILSFVIGVVLVEMIRLFSNNRLLHWRQYILLLEAVLLSMAAIIPSGRYDIIATTIISLSCSMQVEAFRKVKGSVFATTMCTGNLRSGTYHLFQHLSTKDPGSLKITGHYFSVIFVFMAGAIIGGFATEHLGERAIFLCCGVLFIAFVILFIHPEPENTVV